jgi:hypothetical protein
MLHNLSSIFNLDVALDFMNLLLTPVNRQQRRDSFSTVTLRRLHSSFDMQTDCHTPSRRIRYLRVKLAIQRQLEFSQSQLEMS